MQNLKSKAVLLATSTLLGLLVACGSPQGAPVTSAAKTGLNAHSAKVTQLMQAYQSLGQSVQVIDVGKGQKTPGAIAVNLNWGTRLANDFGVQHEDGHIEKVAGDVDQFHLILLEIDSLSPPSPGDCLNPVDLTSAPFEFETSPPLSANIVSFSQNIIFENVPPNSSGEEYRLGVKALESGLNITDCSVGYTRGGSPLAMSPSGVVVDANFAVSPSTPLGVAMQLRNRKGAVLNAEIDVTDGNNTIPSVEVCDAPGPCS